MSEDLKFLKVGKNIEKKEDEFMVKASHHDFVVFTY